MSVHHLESSNPQFYPQALLQMILLKHQLQLREELSTQVQELRQILYTRQSKHRRCDRQIQKNFHCTHCEKVYASEVALKLHQRLKHKHENIVKTVKEKNESQKGEETEHLSESAMGNSRLFIEQN